MFSAFPKFIQDFIKNSYNNYFLEPGDIHDDVIKIVGNGSKLTFVDGGAHEGETIKKVLEYYPDTEIYAFEPIHKKATILDQKYDDKEDVNIYNLALGSKEEMVELNVLESTSSSSLHNPTGKKSQFEAGHAINRQEIVKQVKLSNYVDNTDILKLDLQGGELEALRGIDDIETIDAVMLEMMFLDYYEDQPLFCDLHEHLTSKNFELYNIYSKRRGRVSSTPSGRIKSCDGLYINKRIL